MLFSSIEFTKFSNYGYHFLSLCLKFQSFGYHALYFRPKCCILGDAMIGDTVMRKKNTDSPDYRPFPIWPSRRFASGLASYLNNSLFPLYPRAYIHTPTPPTAYGFFLPSFLHPFSRTAICCQARSRVFPNVANANGISAARSGNQE